MAVFYIKGLLRESEYVRSPELKRTPTPPLPVAVPYPAPGYTERGASSRKSTAVERETILVAHPTRC